MNYILESTQAPTSMDDMIKGMKRGLVISRFWYVRLVDPRTLVLTGLTRDGLWWVENGQIKNPVRNLRFNQSVLAMLAPWNVDAIGAPERLAPYMVPALSSARSRSRRSPMRSSGVYDRVVMWAVPSEPPQYFVEHVAGYFRCR